MPPNHAHAHGGFGAGSAVEGEVGQEVEGADEEFFTGVFEEVGDGAAKTDLGSTPKVARLRFEIVGADDDGFGGVVADGVDIDEGGHEFVPAGGHAAEEEGGGGEGFHHFAVVGVGVSAEDGGAGKANLDAGGGFIEGDAEPVLAEGAVGGVAGPGVAAGGGQHLGDGKGDPAQAEGGQVGVGAAVGWAALLAEGFMPGVEQVAGEGGEEGAIEQGDAQPDLLAPFDGEGLVSFGSAAAHKGGEGVGPALVFLVQLLGELQINRSDDVQKGGLGQPSLGGGELAALGGRHFDDAGVEGGGG